MGPKEYRTVAPAPGISTRINDVAARRRNLRARRYRRIDFARARAGVENELIQQTAPPPAAAFEAIMVNMPLAILT
jgi:hypothetical protein